MVSRLYAWLRLQDTERVHTRPPASRQVLSHPWLRVSKTTPLPETVKALKKFNAARKLKRAALGVVAQEKLAQSASESGFTPAAVYPRAEIERARLWTN